LLRGAREEEIAWHAAPRRNYETKSETGKKVARGISRGGSLGGERARQIPALACANVQRLFKEKKKNDSFAGPNLTVRGRGG